MSTQAHVCYCSVGNDKQRDYPRVLSGAGPSAQKWPFQEHYSGYKEHPYQIWPHPSLDALEYHIQSFSTGLSALHVLFVLLIVWNLDYDKMSIFIRMLYKMTLQAHKPTHAYDNMKSPYSDLPFKLVLATIKTKP